MTIAPSDAASSMLIFYQFNNDVPIRHHTNALSRESMRFCLCYEENGEPASNLLDPSNEVLYTFKKDDAKSIAVARELYQNAIKFQNQEQFAPFITISLKETPPYIMASKPASDPSIRTSFSRLDLSTITQLVGNAEWTPQGEATGLKVEEVIVEFFADKTSQFRNRKNAMILGNNEDIVAVPIFSKSDIPTTQIFK